MNISLTWANYALMVSVCLIVYYLVIVLVYYRKRFQRVGELNTGNISREQDFKDTKSQPILIDLPSFNLFGEESLSENQINTTDDSPSLPIVQLFVEEVEAYTASVEEGVTKEMVLSDLKRILHKYPSLSPNHRYQLNQLIAITCESNCSLHLTADELNGFWME